MGARPDRAGATALLVAVLGLLYYGLLAGGVLWAPPHPYFGEGLYDAYWTSLADGRLDVPARLAYFEGHYDADGRAYLYHGAGPLALRALTAWAVDLDGVTLGALSVFVFAGLGSLLYHRAFHEALRAACPGGVPAVLSLLLGAALWFGGAGVILAANTAFYQEPIAMGYALGGGVVLVLGRVARRSLPLRAAILPLAVLAALMVHARPHLAIGLYAGLGVLGLWLLAKERWRIVPRGALVAAILVASGGGYLALNAAKFGAATQGHAEFAGGAGPVYGSVFWAMEPEDSPRAAAFDEHGRFNARRILPNAALYAAGLPEEGAAGGAILAAYRGATEASLGFIRVEGPVVGLLFLWPVWLLLAAFAFVGERRSVLRGLVLALGLGLGALMMLSYGTVTLRYRVDLWPLIAFLGVLGLPGLVRLGARRADADANAAPPRLAAAAFGVVVLLGVQTSTTVARAYTHQFVTTGYPDEETCRAAYVARGLDGPAARRCAL